MRCSKQERLGTLEYPILLSIIFKKLIAATGIKPAVNQVELHPWLRQDDLLAYCQKENIHLTAYFPLGGQANKDRPSLIEHPTVKKVAQKYPEATPGQVLLSWGLGRGYSVIPKSTNPDRIKSNLRQLKLSSEDMQTISDIGKDEQKRFSIPVLTLGWKIDVFGTPEEAKLPKVLVSNQVPSKL